MSTNPSTYKDHNKSFNDLYNKLFPEQRGKDKVNTVKVEATTKTGSSSAVTTLSREDHNAFVGSFQPKHSDQTNAVDVSLKLDTKGALELEAVASKSRVLPGLKSTLLAKFDDNRPFVGLTFQYSAPWGTTVLSGLAPPQGRKSSKNGHLELSTLLQVHKNVLLGLSGKLAISAAGKEHLHETEQVEGAIAYNEGDLVATAFAQLKPASQATTLGLTYFQLVKHLNAQVGAKFSVNHTATQNAYQIGLVVGKQINTTTFGKLRFDTHGNLGLAVSHKLNDQLKVDAGVDLDVVNPAASPKTNVAIAFTF